MGWDPPLIRRKLNMLRLWKRLICMDYTRFTKHIFLWEYSKCRNNWSHHVKRVFVSIDNIVAFQSCLFVSFENPRYYLQEVTLKLLDKYKQRWKTDIVSQSKLSLLYKHIKREYLKGRTLCKYEYELTSKITSNTITLRHFTPRH